MNIEEISKKYLTQPEAMKYLGVSDDFLLDLRNNGKISFRKYGRVIWYKVSDLDRFVESNKVI